MTITEFAIIPFHTPPDVSDPTLHVNFQKLSLWQSECAGFPLLFFANVNDPLEIHLVTGWESVEAHESWIRGERNQELLRMFKPYVDMQKLRMVHLGVDSEAVSRNVEAAGGGMVVERYEGTRWGEQESLKSEKSSQPESSLAGRNLAQDSGDVYVFRFDAETEVSEGVTPAERWVLRRVEP